MIWGQRLPKDKKPWISFCFCYQITGKMLQVLFYVRFAVITSKQHYENLFIIQCNINHCWIWMISYKEKRNRKYQHVEWNAKGLFKSIENTLPDLWVWWCDVMIFPQWVLVFLCCPSVLLSWLQNVNVLFKINLAFNYLCIHKQIWQKSLRCLQHPRKSAASCSLYTDLD